MSACDRCLRRAWLLARLSGHLEVIRGDLDRVRDVLTLDDETLIEAVAGPGRAEIRADWEGRPMDAGRRAMDAAGIDAVCLHDHRYPAPLRAARDAPAALFSAGPVERLLGLAGAPTVAVVGARRASADGEAVARSLARDLSLAGVTVVSGMAMGVDAAAHRGALQGGGRTIAVLGGGPDVPYPRTERALHGDLVREAAVVSELPPGTPVRRWAFPARNRIIAALSAVTVVVEAAERSGSLITAGFAQALGREVAAVPGRVTITGARGSNALLRDGAVLVQDARDVLDVVLGPGADRPAVAAGPDLDPAAAAILADVRAGRDDVGALCGPERSIGDVLGVLGDLEFAGLVRRGPGGRYLAA